MDGCCGFFASTHGENDGGSTGGDIAAGVYHGFGGGHGFGIDNQAALAGGLQTLGGLADQGIGVGAQTHDHGVHIQNELGSGHVDGRAATGCVWLTQNGLDPDKDVTIVFAEASEIQAKLLSGEIKYAMLPVPAATAAIIKGGGQIRSAVDVTEAWEAMGNGSQLIMTAVVARTEFIEKNPEVIANFLKEYQASIDYVDNNPDAAAELIAGYGITPNAAIAKQAIPQCNLAYIAGRSMSAAISDYFMVLYEVNPAAIGGKLPDDAIYYVP